MNYLWILDPGHGRLQPGKCSPLFADGSRFEEWEFNRDIARRIQARCSTLGIRTWITMPERDVDDALPVRVARANAMCSESNELPCRFVSIHANAAGNGGWNPGVTGVECYHYANSAIGRDMATVFNNYITLRTGWRNRGVKASNDLYVLRHTAMPAVLTESGFFTDPQQASDLMTDAVRQKIAEAHVAAILLLDKK